jgi:hypothetical protein
LRDRPSTQSQQPAIASNTIHQKAITSQLNLNNPRSPQTQPIKKRSPLKPISTTRDRLKYVKAIFMSCWMSSKTVQLAEMEIV